MPSDPLSLHEESLGDRAHVIEVRGELGAATSPQLTESLHRAIDAGRTRVIVDLSETTWLDPSALGRLLVCARLLRHSRGRLALVGSRYEQPRGRLDMTGTGEVLNVCTSRDEAIELMARAGAGPEPARPEVVRLALYVNEASPTASQAIESLRELQRRYLPAAEVEIVDIGRDPGAAERERLVASPTLVRTSPAPVRRIVGDLSDHRQVLDALGLHEAGAPAA
jgi:anti-anti-sigma factor